MDTVIVSTVCLILILSILNAAISIPIQYNYDSTAHAYLEVSRICSHDVLFLSTLKTTTRLNSFNCVERGSNKASVCLKTANILYQFGMGAILKEQ